MEYGYRIIDDLVDGLGNYMLEKGIDSLDEIIGSRVGDFLLPPDLDRESVVFPVFDQSKCLGCGRCYVSCRDGGHQAIEFGPERHPRLLGAKCVGCHLCRLVCPTGAISISKRVPKRK